MRSSALPLFVFAFATTASAACSSSPPPSSPPQPASSPPPSASPPRGSTSISATLGGTLTIQGARVDVPPGALALDTVLTATLLDPAAQPAASQIVGSVVDFGPAGTKFAKPVMLTFDLAGHAGGGPAATIAFLADGAWKPIASNVDGAAVHASTDHFTPYTALAISNVGDPGICDDAKSSAVSKYTDAANGTVSDLTTACRALATDLHAPAVDAQAADATADVIAKMTAWCNVAAAAVRAGFRPGTDHVSWPVDARCGILVAPWVACVGQCDGLGPGCDLKANPPACVDGALLSTCHGDCVAFPPKSVVSCEGACTGQCLGVCTTSAGTTECAAPGCSCAGTCSGTCSASCEGNAVSAVTCDGVCKAEFDAASCIGTALSGACLVDRACDVLCSASGLADASCSAPTVFAQTTNAAIAPTLIQDLPALLVERARASALLDGAPSGGAPEFLALAGSCAGEPSKIAAAINTPLQAVTAATKAVTDAFAGP